MSNINCFGGDTPFSSCFFDKSFALQSGREIRLFITNIIPVDLKARTTSYLRETRRDIIKFVSKSFIFFAKAFHSSAVNYGVLG